jgi:flagellar basal-body rod protein FlgF
MIRGIYSAATALDAAQQNHDAVSENLANATMPGYRRRGLAFESVERALQEANQPQTGTSILGTHVAQEYTGFEAGPLQDTGNPLDVAIDGNGFFVLQGPNGPLYTRNGTFKINANGELQSQDGLPVKGADGPITVPTNTVKISIGRDGTILADKTQVGKLDIQSFADPSQLERAGTTLFTAPAGVQPQTGGAISVHQGYRESSNVQVVNEMVAMIAGMRHFEAAQHALRTVSETMQLNTRPQGA